ncbi:FolC bifunctional protein [Prochlorococcus marinus str. MIT 9312]|uniref:FolC bifunctional protein n=1 Tax=Prochlorococcus marinus (strain MIT 9312) TaxID=74546 RepID=Q319I7_PROM9|nr:Mur ligase family protein [Prochlorococcus marinus]ABB50458.1 FolC bifunctional protein [Prochlorococcus marinus str. MIT 9312]KGG01329.1 Dihydrofolate synthase [Prochlorococcus marinus str. MIT 9311]
MKNANLKNFKLLSPKYERDNIKLGLSRIKKALQKLGNPCKNIPAIQIIGTNGKGSIAAYLESILFEAKMNFGVTTSPHLFDICERIRVNKKNINKTDFEIIYRLIEKNFSTYELTPFEKIICCALNFFDNEKVELIILEAGLGGRLDATTAHKLRPIIAIGNIGLDHKEFLGDTIEKIAKEKLAVIEKNSIVISCNQNSQVENLITKKVEEVGAEIIWKDSTSNSYELGLKGIFQKQNASVAIGVIEALNKLGFSIKEKYISEGLKKTTWQGRLEIITYLNKKILVDCAHNYPAAKALSNERSNWKHEEEGIYWILGVQRQKDVHAILKTLLKKNDHLLLVPVPNQPSWQLKELSQIKEIDFQNIIEFEKFEFAIEYLFALQKWPLNLPVLTGSIFLVAEFIKFANKQKC